MTVTSERHKHFPSPILGDLGELIATIPIPCPFEAGQAWQIEIYEPGPNQPEPGKRQPPRLPPGAIEMRRLRDDEFREIFTRDDLLIRELLAENERLRAKDESHERDRLRAIATANQVAEMREELATHIAAADMWEAEAYRLESAAREGVQREMAALRAEVQRLRAERDALVGAMELLHHGHAARVILDGLKGECNATDA